MFAEPEANLAATTQDDRKHCGFLYVETDALNSFKNNFFTVNQTD